MALTRITKGVIKPNENYDTHNINSTGIITAIGGNITGNLSIGGVLTYEDVTSIDSVGVVTARTGLVSPYADIDDFVSVGSNIHLGNAGVVTATSFVGSGAALTGIDATAIKDSGGNVKIQAQASGAIHTGISTFDTIKVGTGVTIESNGQAEVAGITTFYKDVHIKSGTNRLYLGTNDRLSLIADPSHSYLRNSGSGSHFQIHSDNFSVRSHQGNGSVTLFYSPVSDGNEGGGPRLYHNHGAGIILERLRTTKSGVNIVGTTTSTQLAVTGVSTFTGAIDANGNLDVAGTAVFTGDATFNGGAGAVSISANSDIRFGNGTWTGEVGGKIQQNSNKLYIQGGSSGWQFRSSGGTGRWEIDGNGHITPVADSTYDIGTNSVRVRNFYADTLYGDGSNLTGISQVGGASTVSFNDNVPIYFGNNNDYKVYFNNSKMFFEPTHSGTQQFEMVSNNQMYIKSKASGLFLVSGNQNVIDIYGGSGGGVYFKWNNSQKLKLEGGNWTYLNGATVTHAGDVSIPDSIIHVGDTNTKIRFPAADTFTVETAGSERVRITSAGHLKMPDAKEIQLGNDDQTATGDLRLFHNGANSGVVNSQGALYVQNTATNSSDLHLQGKSSIKMHCPADGDERLTISSTGAVTIGSGTGSSGGGLAIYGGTVNQSSGQDAALYVRHDSNADWGMWLYKKHEYGFRIDSNSSATLSLAIYDQSNNLKHQFFGNGNYTASGSVDSASDIKLKTNIKTIDSALDKVLQLRGAEYDRIDKDNQHEIGVIAQEVEKIIPEVVHGDETKSVSYGNIVAVLIEAIKEQNEVINKMKKELKDLKG